MENGRKIEHQNGGLTRNVCYPEGRRERGANQGRDRKGGE